MWQCLTSNTFNITCWPTTVDLHALPVVVLGPGHLGLVVKLQQGTGQVQIQDILGWGDKISIKSEVDQQFESVFIIYSKVLKKSLIPISLFPIFFYLLS